MEGKDFLLSYTPFNFVDCFCDGSLRFILITLPSSSSMILLSKSPSSRINFIYYQVKQDSGLTFTMLRITLESFSGSRLGQSYFMDLEYPFIVFIKSFVIESDLYFLSKVINLMLLHFQSKEHLSTYDH